MGTKGIFTAISGAMAQSTKLDTIANNIANASTPSFKKDGQIFKEYLSAYEKLPEIMQVPNVPASIESFYNHQGGDKSFVDIKGTYTNFAQGALKTTGNVLDLGIQGKGFFEILMPEGVRFTRNGNFKILTGGTLVTKDGYPVLKSGGDPSGIGREITVSGVSGISIGVQGEIFQNNVQVAKISIVEIDKLEALQKIGGSRYKLIENFNAGVTPSIETKIHQGFLESSNVNIIKEMTDMIATTRTFESLQKAIQAYDSMNDKLVNVIPKY